MAIEHAHIDGSRRSLSGVSPSVGSSRIATVTGYTGTGDRMARSPFLRIGTGSAVNGAAQIVTSRISFHWPAIHPHTIRKNWSLTGIHHGTVFEIIILLATAAI